ncbi:hypothetical protein [Campylobacter vicugnae]|uniref:hypothetical protein n=1 Tax=Campylobacter vicugnae TaxID=1660076 RepID=UPI00254F2EF1|nr:hypothetical protein [Campylobacter ovis]MDL0095913.1 hypothetical protein [Campylobacter ovis]
MANILKACLSDKDIELLEIRDKRYFAVVEILKSLKFILILKGARFFSLLFMIKKIKLGKIRI